MTGAAQHIGNRSFRRAPSPPPVATPPKPSRMTLGNVVKGPVAAPLRVVVYGPEAVGKSTFASNADRPIFLDVEDGTDRLDVARLRPRSWEEIFEAIIMLGTEEHDHQTLVIDTLDAAEQLCWKFVCARGRKTNITDFGYGDGYSVAHEEFRRLLVALDRLREQKGMAVVLLGHSQIKNFKNPEGADFDRYELRLHKFVAGAVREWADVVLFATHETLTHQDERKRTRGVSTGARYIYTERSAAFDAKNRHSLPPALPLHWDDFAQAVAAHQPATTASLHARIAELLTHADEKLGALVTATLMKAGDDAAMLAKIASRLEARIQLQTSEGNQP